MTSERTTAILRDLIAIQTVNPMGRPYAGTVPVERPVVEYIEQLLSPYPVRMQRQACSPIHENLVIELPGDFAADAPVLLFESHMDTVPADDWPATAFSPRIDGDTIYGRGACDDKGSLAAMLGAVIHQMESGSKTPHPVVLVAAGDEELFQTGIKHYAQTAQRSFVAGVFGEPTSNVPIIQHKGTTRWDITTHGRSAHTSQPERGVNAIHAMMRVIEAIAEHERDMGSRFTSPLLTGPSITVTMIHGGRTRNAVPDECTIAVDLRVIPGMDRTQERHRIIQRLGALDVQVSHADCQTDVPPLNTSPEDPFVRVVTESCRRVRGDDIGPRGVPYGSDAAWMPPGAPAIVLGPGSIDRAHAVDECVSLREVAQCAEIYHNIMIQRIEGTSLK